MKRTGTFLADGRELVYFDLTDDAVRELVDPRDLPRVSSSSEVRFDVLTGEWVGIASHRQARTHLPHEEDCPLCPSAGGRQTEIPSEDYDVVVFENRFPSFAVGATLDGSAAGRFPGPELFDRRAGVGRCEVVVFSPDHAASFADLSPEHARLVVEAWADRSVALAEIPAVRQVFCFENRGAEIGVTLPHPHGQIYGYPFVTPRTERMLAQASAYALRTRGNLFDDLLAAERSAGSRVVTAGAEWTAFVPAAARWPFEVHLMPHRRVPDIPALDDAQRDDFALVYLDVLGRLDRLFHARAPYVAAWHQAPVRGIAAGARDGFGVHLQLFSIRRAPGKLKYLAGSESGMGVFVNDVRPEKAAAMLRDAQ